MVAFFLPGTRTDGLVFSMMMMVRYLPLYRPVLPLSLSGNPLHFSVSCHPRLVKKPSRSRQKQQRGCRGYRYRQVFYYVYRGFWGLFKTVARLDTRVNPVPTIPVARDCLNPEERVRNEKKTETLGKSNLDFSENLPRVLAERASSHALPLGDFGRSLRNS